MAHKTKTHKCQYIQAYIHFRTGVLIREVAPPKSEEHYQMMNSMYMFAKRYMVKHYKETYQETGAFF